MKLVRDLRELSPDDREGAVAIGNFDGVHHGHAGLIERLVKHARAVNGPATVFTFEPHPVRILRPDFTPPPLTWTNRKAQLLGNLGVDLVVAYPTDTALLSLTAEEFFEEIILKTLAAKAVVEGPNFFFGKNRQGDTQRLQELCSQNNLTLEIVTPHSRQDRLISSSRIRELLAAGDVDTAVELLTQPYRLRGLVTHGAHRGSRIGFPTANVDGVDTLVPGHGVYAGRAYVAEKPWPAAINIGPNPTFAEHANKIEIHLIGFDGNLYGEPLEVDFLARLRDIQTFAGVEQLKNQLNRDIVDATAICESREPS